MTPTPPTRPSAGYRPDIDGLRAIAVLSVVLFHARVAPFSGGYVGVDIFFVISGFLITRLIADDIELRRFSIVHFYERRIRRIFPALYLVVLVCFIPAVWLLMPLDLKRFGEAAAATTVFLSNALFWHRSGYFGESATVQPLLHTWSLAVEEQFYVVYPLFLILLMRLMRGHGRRILLIAGVLLASLIASVVITRYWPSAGFYLPASRAWELLLGAMLALRPPAPITNRALREAVAAAGLGAILAAIFLFSPETAFPGYAALLPCLGAAALIYVGASGQSMAASALGAPACRFVGLISYSFYLWHWPLIVFTQYWYDQQAPAWAVALAVLASGALGALSWRWIERPFRQKGTFPRRWIFILAAVVSALVFVLGAAVSYLQGLPGRFDSATLTYAAGEKDVSNDRVHCLAASPHGANLDTLCRMGADSPAPPTFILWGDSHAEAMRSAVSDAAALAGRTGVFAGRPGCPPMLEVTRTDTMLVCEPFSRRVMDAILQNPDLTTVVLDGRWGLYGSGTRYKSEDGASVYLTDHQTQAPGYAENAAVFARGMERTVDALLNAGKQVILVGPIPEIGYHVPRSLAIAQAWDRQPPPSPTEASFLERQAVFFEVAAELADRDGLTIVLPHELLCTEGSCRIADNGHALYFDDDHLSTTGAHELTGLFRPLLQP